MTREIKERKAEFTTTVGGPAVNRVYTAADIAGQGEKALGEPGQFPFTRNVQPAGYRSRLWTMRQYSGFATVQETNERYKYLYRQGQTGFSVAFHLPTQQGFDSDHPLALGEVGRCGVAIDSLPDMEQMWDGIPLGEVSTSMTINATAPIILAMYIAAAEKQGADPAALAGTVQNDLLKEYVARNTYIFAPAPSMRLVTDVCSYCSTNLPKWNSISISGYHMREAGATAAQEVGFTLANGIAYVEAMLARGMEIDAFAPRFSFFFTTYGNLFEEAAKLRAARRMWARIVKERFGSDNPRAQMLRFHVQTGGATLTEQQPLNNITRVTIQALAAVLGGCQSLHACSYDEALALPSEAAVQLSLRTQQVIAHESGIADTVDPLGGSYYVEALTNQVEEEAMNYIKRIDEMGGAVGSIEAGFMQREIANSSYNHQKAVDSGEQIVVGLNDFKEEEETEVEIFAIDPTTEKRQVERLDKLRAERDGGAVKEVLERVRQTAETDENVMPVLIEAVKAHATVGEISDALRAVFGDYREPNIL